MMPTTKACTGMEEVFLNEAIIQYDDTDIDIVINWYCGGITISFHNIYEYFYSHIQTFKGFVLKNF